MHDQCQHVLLSLLRYCYYFCICVVACFLFIGLTSDLMSKISRQLWTLRTSRSVLERCKSLGQSVINCVKERLSEVLTNHTRTPGTTLLEKQTCGVTNASLFHVLKIEAESAPKIHIFQLCLKTYSYPLVSVLLSLVWMNLLVFCYMHHEFCSTLVNAGSF